MNDKKDGWRLAGKQEIGEPLYWISVERTHSRKRNPGWTCFQDSYLVPCTQSSSISSGIREECVRLTRTPSVRYVDFTNPMGCAWGAQISLSTVKLTSEHETMTLLAHLSLQQNDKYAPYNTYFARYTMAWPLAYQTAFKKNRHILLGLQPTRYTSTYSSRYDLVPA